MNARGWIAWWTMAEHYFSSTPQSPFVEHPLRVRLAGAERDLVTAGGVFSPKGLDKGTAVLLEEVPAPTGATALDIGCGWGPIALTLALENPAAAVTAVDVNERSLELTRINAARLGLDNVTAGPPEQVDPGLRFDEIWSNPPIRIGKPALHELLLTWLPRLAEGGRAHLVVQKNLGADSLQKWLAQTLEQREPGAYNVARAATSRGFRVLRVQRG